MSSKIKTIELINMAREVQNYSQAKYSDFKVGAALETTQGKIFTGTNVESSSYGLSICAERVALTKALSEGEIDFNRIAIVGPENDFCPPCGACRQLLYDYCPELLIVLSDSKNIKQIELKSLLPYAFSESKLKSK
jgi:cytidine deaminase